MDLGIKGKRVLVTGASQSLGEEIALQFALEGCKVSVVARREKELRDIVEKMGGQGKGHSFYATDLMENGTPTQAIKELTKNGGNFEIVIHNVGGTLSVRDPLSPREEWDKVWQFNAGIAIEMNATLIPPMQERGWGRVVHISSISGEALRGSTPYAASKAFLNAYVKGIGRSIAPTGVVISALMPGAFMSPGSHWDNIRQTNPAMMEDFLRHHHGIGRMGTIDEIAPFALFMASQYATFATAALIPIDGGTM